MKAKKFVIFLIGTLLLLVFLSLMFTYQVRSTEIVLVTPWSGPPEIKYGSADMMSEEVRKARKAKGLPENDAGIKFRLPWPLQKVYELDGRVHVMETGFDEELGAGGETVQVAVYVGWNVSDAEKFRSQFERFRSADAMMREAHVQLGEFVSDARSEVLGITKLMDFLAVDGAGPSVYDQAEKKIRAKVAVKAMALGLEIKFLGIKRVGVPGDLANGIIHGMTQYKQTQIKALNEETDRERNTILNTANTQARAIIGEAESNATRMRNAARKKVIDIYAQADNSPEKARLAITLKQIKALGVLRGKNMQLIINDKHPLFNFLSEGVQYPAPKK
jgi:regulator of protease activity HflC (stomatin/prohibitin superfamily)